MTKGTDVVDLAFNRRRGAWTNFDGDLSLCSWSCPGAVRMPGNRGWPEGVDHEEKSEHDGQQNKKCEDATGHLLNLYI